MGIQGRVSTALTEGMDAMQHNARLSTKWLQGVMGGWFEFVKPNWALRVI